MIEVSGLTKSYDDFQALKGVSFTVNRGEIVGFLGPNGAGKTTTMKILTCYMPQTKGTVTIDGQDVNADALAVRARMGYLPESTPLYTDMLVYDYLHHVATVRGVPKDKVKARIKAACEMCGIVDRIGQSIGTLSKGYKQRVGLAQALIHDPDILILDEPTSGLDPNQIVEIRNLIKRLGENRTIILSTHNLPEVMATCTRLLIINKGEIVADGTAQELEQRQAEFERLQVLVRGVDPELAATVFRELPGVKRCEVAPSTEAGVAAIEIEAPRGGDLRAQVFKKAVERHWELLGLTRVQLDLEGLFRKLTREV
ncbi:MAG: ATP-binding cassette domain-containing protein [Deltaproteobacteria bacterium]|jgi:ABC-2 type transport system ATP-binding protein|nr:ATP-binding cassette domain-containing protein [Deltaproteobacteria bacterium]